MMLLAIVFEVCGTLCMKVSIESPLWRAAAYGFYGVSFTVFPFALEGIPLNIAYATWSSVGSAAVVVLSWILFKEELSVQQAVGVLGIVLSVGFLHLNPEGLFRG